MNAKQNLFLRFNISIHFSHNLIYILCYYACVFFSSSCYGTQVLQKKYIEGYPILRQSILSLMNGFLEYILALSLERSLSNIVTVLSSKHFPVHVMICVSLE